MAPDEGLKCFNAIELAIFCSTCSDSTYYSDVFPSLIDVYDYTYIFDQALDTNLTRMEIETDMFMILDADSDKYLKLGTGAKVIASILGGWTILRDIGKGIYWRYQRNKEQKKKEDEEERMKQHDQLWAMIRELQWKVKDLQTKNELFKLENRGREISREIRIPSRSPEPSKATHRRSYHS